MRLRWLITFTEHDLGDELGTDVTRAKTLQYWDVSAVGETGLGDWADVPTRTETYVVQKDGRHKLTKVEQT